MKNKFILIITIILMSIGFAAVSTSLIINSNIKVSENNEDFSVIFTKASLDGEDVYSSVVDDTKKVITFTSKDLMKIGDSSTLTYEVTNNSNNYDAEVKITCVPSMGTTAKYTSIKNKLENDATVVKAKETLTGTLTVNLDKQSTEEVSEEYTCKLEFNAVEREELGYNGPTEWTFDYTGGEQTFIAPMSGTYKLETWGAQGGESGGYGGYSSGYISLTSDEKLYVNVGGLGGNNLGGGGYNGGGRGYSAGATCGGGGGATHIATEQGLLSTFSSKVDDLLIVSGGGGGTCSSKKGGNGGGLKGTGTSPGTQNSGYSFGQGAGVSSGQHMRGGGGGGFYGGGHGDNNCGFGGSGYIGNELLTEKSMYCYNCTESSEESTKTVSTTCISETPTENCSKKGNGYARITLIKK